MISKSLQLWKDDTGQDIAELMNKSLLSAVFNLAVTEQSGQTAVYVTSQAGDRIPSQRFIFPPNHRHPVRGPA